MKLSYNWLKQYIDLSHAPEDLSEILTDLGLEVEGLDKIETIPGGLAGLVIGEVMTCVKHPNADKLSLTTVNVGQPELLQIVCGAPNVAAGQKVVIATVNTMLYPIAGEPFKIKKGKIRGEASEGMICAEDEIGIGTDHNGIIVLPESIAVGTPAADYYNPGTDYVYEIGLTPNRSDATSHIGVAKDLAAYFTFHDNEKKSLKAIDMVDSVAVGTQHIQVDVRDQQGCPRFSGISLAEVKIGPSPEWIQDHLKAVGIRPISNVVDITNYVLHELGQPLHAYDQDKIPQRKIIVETLPENTLFVSLDAKERTLSGYDLAICDADLQPIGLAGVFGGMGTGVSDQTTSVFLEAAHFDAQRIRKTSTKHNLRTDAAKCFEKGSDPNITVTALRRAAYLMIKYAGAKVASDLVDIYPKQIRPAEIEVSLTKVNKMLGTQLSGEEIQRIFGALSMNILHHDGVSYKVSVPTDKADVTREADVIEEILRIYGFNNVVVDNRINTAVTPTAGITKQQLRSVLSALLVGDGFNEMMGMSLIPSAKYVDTIYTDRLVEVNNTSNVHLDIMRPEMMSSGLLSVAHNINRQQSDLSLFEFGRSYAIDGDKYKEEELLTVFMLGRSGGESWKSQGAEVDFYDIKRVVHRVFQRSGIDKYQVADVEDERFAYGLKYYRGANVMASFGEVSSPYLSNAGIKETVFYAEIAIGAMHKAVAKTSVVTTPIPKFPSSRRDLALIVDHALGYGDIEAILKKGGGRLLAATNLFDVYQDATMKEQGKKSYAVSMTFVDPEASLKDKQLDKIVQKIVGELSTKLGATLRS